MTKSERLQIAYDESKSAIVFIDSAGTLIEFNPAFKAMANRENVPSGANILDIVSFYKRVEGDKWLHEAIRKITQGVERIEDRVFFRIRDDDPAPREAEIKMILLQDGVILMFIEDITEKTQAERRMMQSERMATVGRLAANLAHELNSPLDGVLRYVGFLQEDLCEDDPRRKYLSRIRDGLERMSRIIKGLLYFSRDRSQMVKPVDPNKMIEETVSFFQEQIQRYGIEVEMNLSPSIPSIIYGDMEHVIINLVKNAIQAMPNGGKLTLETDFDEWERIITIRIIDTGMGIPPEILQNIFLPFFTTKEVGQGTGLGLSICKGIVERYNGEITVDSDVRRGTVVTVRIPIRREVDGNGRCKNTCGG